MIFLSIKYEPLSDHPVIKLCEWAPWYVTQQSMRCIYSLVLTVLLGRAQWAGHHCDQQLQCKLADPRLGNQAELDMQPGLVLLAGCSVGERLKRMSS